MLIRTLVATVIAALFLLSPMARAEVRNLTPAELQEQADTIVIASVLGNYESHPGGRRTAYVTEFRVLEVIKGDVELSERITGSWYRNELMPMTVGTAGHRGELPEVGGIVKVHLNEDGRVLLPNGFQPAEARYITDELIEASDPEAIRAACEQAGRHDLFREIIRGIEHLRDSGEANAADQLLLARAAGAIGQFERSMNILRPLLESADHEIRNQARRIYLAAAWSLDDDQAYLKAIDDLIAISEGEEKQEFEQYRQDAAMWLREG